MAETTKTMQVGRIPSLTWNRLKVNYSLVEGDLSVQEDVATTFEGLPEGISGSTLTQKQAQDWLLANAPEEKAEAVVAGKEPIYHPQAFGTGLGKEYDDFVQGAAKSVRFLEVAEGQKIERPILWDVNCERGARAVTSQILHVGKNSALTLVMTENSDRDASGASLVSTKVVLEEGAQLHLVEVQLLGKGFLSMHDVGAALKDDASLEVTGLYLGAEKTYLGTQAELVGKASRLMVDMGYLVTGKETCSVNVNAVQRGRKTQVQMHFDGVLDGAAQKNFCGTIDFRRGSKGSVGNEQENVLLLSDDIVNKTLPVILCEEEDVEGRHGASIGRLDEQMLFYLAARGIDEKTAEQMMVRARLRAVASHIPVRSLREQIRDFIEETFKG
ncbi:MAG: SufB/SufD family protein [Lachnospiraceae bacterium]